MIDTMVRIGSRGIVGYGTARLLFTGMNPIHGAVFGITSRLIIEIFDRTVFTKENYLKLYDKGYKDSAKLLNPVMVMSVAFCTAKTCTFLNFPLTINNAILLAFYHSALAHLIAAALEGLGKGSMNRFLVTPT